MLEPKYLPSDNALLSRLDAVFHYKSECILAAITSAEEPDIVVVGLPGSGRTHAMHLIIENFKNYRMRDLDVLPVLAQISGFQSEPKDSHFRSVTKTRVNGASYLRLYPFADSLLIDESYLWLNSGDIADIFPPVRYSNEFRSALDDRFGGWPAGVSAVVKRIALGEKALQQTIDDATDDLATRYFAKFFYGLHDSLIDDILFCVAARGCTLKLLNELGFAGKRESVERFRLKGLVDVVGADERIAIPRPVVAASHHQFGRLSVLGFELADSLNRHGNIVDAAMVLQNVGATLAALSLLQTEKKLPYLALSDDTAERECLRLDDAVIIHDPFLWLSVYTHRSRLVSGQQLLAEVENLLAATDEDLDGKLLLREILLLIRDIHLSEIKRPQLDEQHVRRVVEHWQETPYAVMVAFLAGSHCAINGLYKESETYFVLAQSLANHEANVVTYGNARLLRLVRCQGDMIHEAEFSKYVFHLTKFASSPSAQNSAYFEVATSAWLLGDEELFDAAIVKLERIDGSRFLAPYKEFTRAARGLNFDERCGSSYFQSWMLLVAGLLPNREQADAELLKRAYDLSRVSGSRFLEGIAGMAYARTLSGPQREHLLESIVVTADEFGQYTLASRAKELMAGQELESELHPGWLKRYATDRFFGDQSIPHLALFEGVATIDGERVSLGEKTHMLLTLLSVAPGDVSAASLMSAIWPDATNESARNALKMCVRRTRNVLRSENAITKTHLGYQIDPSLRSDIGEMQKWIEDISESEAASSMIETGAEFLLALLKGLPLELQRYDAFDDIRPMLTTLERDVKSRLMDRLSRHACSGRTRDIVRQMSQFDPETAEEFHAAIESHVHTTP